MPFRSRLAVSSGMIAAVGLAVAAWEIHRIYAMDWLSIKREGQVAATVATYAILIASAAAVVAIIGLIDWLSLTTPMKSPVEKGLTPHRRRLIIDSSLVIVIVLIVLTAGWALSLSWRSQDQRMEIEITSIELQKDNSSSSDFILSVAGTIRNTGMYPGSGYVAFEVSDGRGYTDRHVSHMGIVPGESQRVGASFTLPVTFQGIGIESTPIWWYWEIGFSDYNQITGRDAQIDLEMHGPIFVASAS